MAIQEETMGQTQDLLKKLYLLAGLGKTFLPHEELVKLAMERSVWVSQLRLLPLRSRTNCQKMKQITIC